MFPCGDGDGTPKATLIGSFSGAPHQPNLISMDGEIHYAVFPTLPDFFRFTTPAEPTNCNPGAVFSYERPASCVSASSLCDDGLCDYAFGVVTDLTDPGLAPFEGRMLFSVFRLTTIDAAANTDYFVFKLDIYADAATEPGGSCAGCGAQAAFVFRRLGLLAPVVPGNQDYSLTSLDCATWNGGTSICAATPTRNQTWCALKSLYR